MVIFDEWIATGRWYNALGGDGLVAQGTAQSWAITSIDNRYRYALGRQWDYHKPLWCYLMINPSKARHDVDDHTIRKCVGFAKRGDAGGFAVGNLLAFSSFDIDEVVAQHQRGIDVRGDHNRRALEWVLSLPATRRVAAWGRIPPPLKLVAALSAQQIFNVVNYNASKLECFGHNQDGSPKHPLMLAYSTPLVVA